MSISNRHPLNPFTSGASQALSGQRLAKIGYKSSKTAPAKYPSVCASVPPLARDDISARIDRLMPALIGLLESAQDGIIRSLYESSHGDLSAVSDSDISIDACISYLAASAGSDRLTVEALESWFDTHLCDALTVIIADKLGFDLSTPEQLDTVGKNTSAYRALLSSCAGGKTVLNAGQIAGLRRAITFGPDDTVSEKIIARLDGMERKGKVDLIDLL